MKDILEINSNRRADLDLIIGTFLSYICVVVIVCLFKNDQSSFYDIYFLIINFSLLSILFFTRKFSFFKKNKINDYNIIPLVIVSIPIITLAGYILYNSSLGRDIWLDEYTQFIQDPGNNGISTYAAIQQQPPLDYFFSAFARFTLGFDPLAVKIHNIIFFILTILSSLYISFIQSKKIHLAVIYPLSLMTSSLVCFYSYEARPMMLSLFTGTLFIFTYFQYLHLKNISLFYILITQTLFLFSIGLQPVILIISCFMGAIVYERGITKKIKNLFYTHLVSALIFSIFFGKMILISKEFNKFKYLSLTHRLEEIKHINVDYFLRYFEHQSSFILYFLLPLVSILTIIMIFKKIKIRNGPFHIVFSLFFFIVSFDLIYTTTVNWNFQSRYIITISTLFAYIAYQSAKGIDDIINKKNNFLFRIFPFVLLLCRDTRQYNGSLPYKEIYNYLETNATSKDLILNFSLRSTGSWRPFLFVSKEIYYNKKKSSLFIHSVHFPEIKDNIPIDVENKTLGSLYLIQFREYTPEIIFYHEYSLKNIESFYLGKEFNHIRIIKIKKTDMTNRPFEEYLYYLLKKFKYKNELALVYETLAIIKIDQGEYKAALEIIAKYERLKGNHKYTHEGIIYDFQSDLKKRVSFLKKRLEKRIKR